MLSTKNRLRTKDVMFIVNRRQYIPAGMFWFFYYTQYPNRKFNQISFHVSIKLSKSAVRRRIYKRSVMNYIRENKLQEQSIGWKYYKIFININKNRVEELSKLIETWDKKYINKKIQQEFANSFNHLKKKLWKS